MRRYIEAIAVIVVCLFCQGCFTTLLWDNVGQNAWYSDLQGFVSDQSGADSKEVDYLVVSYISSSTWPRKETMRRYAIPCKGSLISAPVAYRGTSRNRRGVIDSITNEQLGAIRVSFNPAAEGKSQTILQPGEYTESKAFVVSHEAEVDWGKDIALVPYWWKPDGGPQARDDCWRFSSVYSEKEYDARCRLLIVPRWMPKRESERIKNVSLAAAESPFAVVADLVLFPVEAVFFLFLFHD